jgi:hypothetical protein
MPYSSQDDEEIFSLLETQGLAGFDMRSPAVVEFSHGTAWGLVLFMPEGEHRGCRLLQARLEERGEPEELMRILLRLPESGGYAPLREKALGLLERRLQAAPGQADFFDAH